MQNKDFKIDIKATKLDLIGQKIGDGRAAALAKALPDAKNLTSLNLAGNNIDDAGAAALARELPRTSLTELDLSYNNIDYTGAAALARELPRTSLTLLELYSNISSAGEAEILRVAIENPLFLTQVNGLRNSYEIYAVVDANRQRLEITATVGVCSLEKNHRFPVSVAVMVARYVNGEYIKEQDIKSISEDKEAKALLAPEESLTKASTPEVSPAISGSFAPLVPVAEVASGDDDQNRADEMSRGPGL